MSTTSAQLKKVREKKISEMSNNKNNYEDKDNANLQLLKQHWHTTDRHVRLSIYAADDSKEKANIHTETTGGHWRTNLTVNSVREKERKRYFNKYRNYFLVLIILTVANNAHAKVGF